MKILPSRPLRLPRLRTYVPTAADPKIFWFNSERADIVEEVARRVVDRYHDDEAVELALNDAAFHEARRLEAGDQGEDGSLEFWRGVLRRIGRMSSDAKFTLLREISVRMTKDVAGNFDPRVYKFASRVVPSLLTAVMKPSNVVRTFRDETVGLERLVAAEGPIEQIRRLQERGTLVLVPTHSSNLDSLAIAWVLFRSGLHPVVYGAGKNLFSNPIISFFMHNLGAYRIDRRIKAGLYKEILKTYSTAMIERGYHSLFFPGGTRSRSGAIERRLKLGLASTGISAFARNAVRGVNRPVYFVPATINYALVLEAETLIDDYLRESGRARYIIEDDEFSRIDRWIAFFNRFQNLQSAAVIRFGEPIDPFCNPVDEDGRSISPSGKVIDPVTYVSRRGSAVTDAARDAAYTKALGEAIADRYVAATVVMPTQLVAHIIMRRIVRATPGLDLFARLRFRGEIAIPMNELVEDVARARDALVALEQVGKVHINSELRHGKPDELVEVALVAWAAYHQRPIVRRLHGSLVVEDPNLVLFYSNRLRDFAVALAGSDPADRQAANDIAVMETEA